MGVDLTIFKGTGYCIFTKEIAKIIGKYHNDFFEWLMEELDDNDLVVEYQDGYGDINGDSSIFIGKTDEVLFSCKVGYTPLTFLQNQMYGSNDKDIRGGAQKYFAVALNFNYAYGEHVNGYEEIRNKILNGINEIKEKISNDIIDYYDDSVPKEKVVEMLLQLRQMLLSKDGEFNQWLYSYYH